MKYIKTFENISKKFKVGQYVIVKYISYTPQLYDFLNNNNLPAIESRGVFQFYPMVNLWSDIQSALQAGLKLTHLTAEPVSVAELSATGFGKTFHQILAGVPATYDFQTKYADVFGGHGAYQYSRRETIQAIRAYAQSEPISIKTESGRV